MAEAWAAQPAVGRRQGGLLVAVSDAASTSWTFAPAQTEAEAISRIHALTGSASQGTRGEKRALIALRDALGLDVEIARTNATLGSLLAAALDVEWQPDAYTERNTVTLGGLNALLAGATAAYQAGRLGRLRADLPDVLTGPQWTEFQPARSKLEAVTRIAALTGAPKEWLGPGGKEHKSVLVNLADRMLPDRRLDRSSKTRLGASLAAELAVPWTDLCASTGETISLIGLNTILAGAERHLGRLGSTTAAILRTPADEGDALAAALVSSLEQHWDGMSAVEWMTARALRGANDNEWQGFYGEAIARQVLHAAFTPRTDPPRVRYGNTVFDYALNWVWDIKVHTQPAPGRTTASDVTILNDEQAIRSCVAEQGLGFLVIGGHAEMDDDGAFRAWQRERKLAAGRKPAASNSGLSRTRKRAFNALHVEAFWIPDQPALLAAITAGQVRVHSQGRQAPRGPDQRGAPRRTKLAMSMHRARHGLLLAAHDWHTRTP